MYIGPQEYVDEEDRDVRLTIKNGDLDDLAGDERSRMPRRDNQSARLFLRAIDTLAKTK